MNKEKIKGQWTILGCNQHGFWLADRFYYTFNSCRERLEELIHALKDAAYWQSQREDDAVYTVVELF